MFTLRPGKQAGIWFIWQTAINKKNRRTGSWTDACLDIFVNFTSVNLRLNQLILGRQDRWYWKIPSQSLPSWGPVPIDYKKAELFCYLNSLWYSSQTCKYDKSTACNAYIVLKTDLHMCKNFIFFDNYKKQKELKRSTESFYISPNMQSADHWKALPGTDRHSDIQKHTNKANVQHRVPHYIKFG